MSAAIVDRIMAIVGVSVLVITIIIVAITFASFAIINTNVIIVVTTWLLLVSIAYPRQQMDSCSISHWLIAKVQLGS